MLVSVFQHKAQKIHFQPKKQMKTYQQKVTLSWTNDHTIFYSCFYCNSNFTQFSYRNFWLIYRWYKWMKWNQTLRIFFFEKTLLANNLDYFCLDSSVLSVEKCFRRYWTKILNSDRNFKHCKKYKLFTVFWVLSEFYFK